MQVSKQMNAVWVSFDYALKKWTAPKPGETLFPQRSPQPSCQVWIQYQASSHLYSLYLDLQVELSHFDRCQIAKLLSQLFSSLGLSLYCCWSSQWGSGSYRLSFLINCSHYILQVCFCYCYQQDPFLELMIHTWACSLRQSSAPQSSWFQ